MKVVKFVSLNWTYISPKGDILLIRVAQIVVAAGLFYYMSGLLPYMQCHITVKYNVLSVSLNKHFFLPSSSWYAVQAQFPLLSSSAVSYPSRYFHLWDDICNNSCCYKTFKRTASGMAAMGFLLLFLFLNHLSQVWLKFSYLEGHCSSILGGTELCELHSGNYVETTKALQKRKISILQ